MALSDSGCARPSVSIVVPTRARGQLLSNCVRSLLAQNYPSDRFSILVVEDGTNEGEKLIAGMAASPPVSVRYVRIPHKGLAAARNVGLELSREEIVAFIDDDAMATPEWLGRLVQGLLEEGVAGIGGRVSPEYPEHALEARMGKSGDLFWSSFNASPPTVQEVDYLPGGNMAFWRRALLEVRGLDTRYTKTVCWREETDVCLRLRRRGYRLLYDGEARIIHRAIRWANPWERFRPKLVWAMTRDDAYFRAKNYGWSGVWGALRSTAASIRSRIIQGAANILLIPVHLFAWIPGAVNGLRNRNDSYGTLRVE